MKTFEGIHRLVQPSESSVPSHGNATKPVMQSSVHHIM